MPLGCKISFINKAGERGSSYHYPGVLNQYRILTPGNEFDYENIHYINNLVVKHNNGEIKITSITTEGDVIPKTWCMADKINSVEIISEITQHLRNNRRQPKPRW